MKTILVTPPILSILTMQNFVIIHQPWLKKMLGETGKVAKRGGFLLIIVTFPGQFTLEHEVTN